MANQHPMFQEKPIITIHIRELQFINVSESLNSKLKRLIDYKKAMDENVMYFHKYHLQWNDLSTLIRAFCGESEWSFMSHLKFASLDADSVIF